MKYAQIGPISSYLPSTILTNDQLREQYPQWNIDLIEEKTGIYARHVAGKDEFVSDMAIAASEKLFSEHNVDRNSIDYLLLCTQTPDYNLPTTACILQDKLRLSTDIGALDFNLGCSGYVIGLSLAQGLIASGIAKRILLITSECYTKYIDDEDRSLRTIFGDGATATLIEAGDEPTLGPFLFKCVGSGADTLVALNSGARQGSQCLTPRGRKRWSSQLFMNGPELISFAADYIPGLTKDILKKANLTKDDIDYYLLHQATLKMIDDVSFMMSWPKEKVPLYMRDIGNTVSSTIPLLIENMRNNGTMTPGKQNLLIGFGVGLSAGICVWRESFTGASK